ncbi:hypothetical protein V8E55_002428 [Tylopilus felleus]
MALQHALDDFHRLKDVFIELGCRDQFNIPKFHSLIHYTDTIRNLGSLDGLNTETSERLHINVAKKAYAATSRKDYTIQMTRWLQWQEVAIWFNPESHLQDLQHCPVTALCISQSYRIFQQPQFPKKTIQYLEQHHGVVCFTDTLKAFVNTLPRRHGFFQPNANDRFDVFSNLVLFMPPIEHAMSKNERIQSHPQCYNAVRKPPTQARYDTVLVEVDSEL